MLHILRFTFHRSRQRCPTLRAESVGSNHWAAALRAEAPRFLLAGETARGDHGFQFIVRVHSPRGDGGLEAIAGGIRRGLALVFIELAQHFRAALDKLPPLERVVLGGNLAQRVVEIQFGNGVENSISLGQERRKLA